MLASDYPEYNSNCLSCQRRKSIDTILRNMALMSDADLEMFIEMSDKLAEKQKESHAKNCD